MKRLWNSIKELFTSTHGVATRTGFWRGPYWDAIILIVWSVILVANGMRIARAVDTGQMGDAANTLIWTLIGILFFALGSWIGWGNAWFSGFARGLGVTLFSSIQNENIVINHHDHDHDHDHDGLR